MVKGTVLTCLVLGPSEAGHELAHLAPALIARRLAHAVPASLQVDQPPLRSTRRAVTVERVVAHVVACPGAIVARDTAVGQPFQLHHRVLASKQLVMTGVAGTVIRGRRLQSSACDDRRRRMVFGGVRLATFVVPLHHRKWVVVVTRLVGVARRRCLSQWRRWVDCTGLWMFSAVYLVIGSRFQGQSRRSGNN